MNASMGEQIRIYFGKNGRIFFNEKKYISIILSTVLMTLMIGMVTGSEMFAQYSATRNGAFALVCACIWIGIFNSIQSICKERATIKEEKRNNGLDLMAYTLAHVLFDAIVCFFEALLVTLIIFLLKKNNIPGESSFPTVTVLKYLFTFFLVIFSSDVFGLAASAFSLNTEIAMTIMPFLLIVQLLLSGFVFSLDGVMKALSNATISKWGLNAICIAADVNHLSVPSDNYIMAALKNDYYDQYNPKQFHLLRIWLILLLITVIFVLLTRLFISTVEKDKR